MVHSHFDELQKWSERKHELLIKYLDAFVRILGRSVTGTVFYVDGFAGPGTYKDGSSGSPILAADFAIGLAGRDYTLRCINVEDNKQLFQNLEAAIEPYKGVASCFEGRFEDHVEVIMEIIGDNPTIFFLDPFGVKGIEWKCLLPILQRTYITELLVRVNPKDISRLAGFFESQSIEAEGKRKLLTQLFGFDSVNEWGQVWKSDGTDGLINLYFSRIVETLKNARGNAFVYNYPIRTIEGEVKYFLLFGTCHPKGATLMSKIIYGRERSYKGDVRDYKEKIKQSDPHRQFDMFSIIDPNPTEEEVTAMISTELSDAIFEECAGLTVSRDKIEEKMLGTWFGKAGTTHFTRALKKLEDEGRILERIGSRSRGDTEFKFASTSTFTPPVIGRC